MKYVKKKIVRIILMMCFLTISVYCNAQELSRKEIRRAEKLWNYQVLDSLLSAKSFVVEADFLQNKYGIKVPVNSSLNFIRVEDPDGVIQTGSDTRMGTNSVGGVTAEGTIGSWKVQKNPEKLRYTVRFNVFTQIGNYDVLMTVNADNQVSATISGTTSGKLTWIGRLNTIANSRVFKGMKTI
jgi:hypothetical protein